MDSTVNARDAKVKHMIAELQSLEIESSLPGEVVPGHDAPTKSSSAGVNIEHHGFLPRIADAGLIDRELSQFDNEFLEDFSTMADEVPHAVTVDAAISPTREDSAHEFGDKTLYSSTASTVISQHEKEQLLSDSTSKLNDSDVLEKETNFLNRLIDVQPCQRINTSILNVNRIQHDFGTITAIASCPECIAMGSSGGYLLVFDNSAGKVIARFDRSDALGAVSALDVNPRGTRALCGYSRGHVALIDLQKCYQRSGSGPLVAGGSGEFLKTVSVASPLPSPILQVRFCSSLSGNSNDDTNITSVCLESGGSVFRLRFRRLLNIITCDTDCIFSGARGEAFLIEPFAASAPSLMPEHHPLRVSQLVAIGTLNKALLISLTDNTIDVFLNIPLSSNGNSNTPDGSIVPDGSTTVTSSSRRRSSSANTLLSSSSFSHHASNDTNDSNLHATSYDGHRASQTGDGRHLPCASWAFSSVQPTTASSESVLPPDICRDPVLAVTCGLHLMLVHVYRDIRTRMPMGRLIKDVSFDQTNLSDGRHLPILTSIVNVKWLNTVTLLLFDATGTVLLYDLRTNQVEDFIVPAPLENCDINTDLSSMSDNNSIMLHSAKSSRSSSTVSDQQQHNIFAGRSFDRHDADDRGNTIRQLFSNRSAYSGGGTDSFVSEAMVRAGEYATYTSVSSTITVRPLRTLAARKTKRRESEHKNSVDFGMQQHDGAENTADSQQQRVFCLFANNTLCCLRLRTAKERLDELEQCSLYADALEFALSVYKSKTIDEAVLISTAEKPARRISLAKPTMNSPEPPGFLRSDLHRLLLNTTSQIVAHNKIFCDTAAQQTVTNSSTPTLEKLLLKRDAVARQLQRSVRLCFGSLSLLCDPVLLADFYSLVSFQSHSSFDNDNDTSDRNLSPPHIVSARRILCQSVSPENEFFIYLPTLLEKNSEKTSSGRTTSWYETQMPELLKRFMNIVDNACEKKCADKKQSEAVGAEKSIVPRAESIVRVCQQTQRRLLQTFGQLTLEADMRWFDIDATLTVARRLLQSHTIMRMSIDVKNDFVSPLSEFVVAMRCFSAGITSKTNLEEQRSQMLLIESHVDFQHVGNNLIFYLSENLKGRRCVSSSDSKADGNALIKDVQLRRRVQEATWQWLMMRPSHQNSNDASSQTTAENSNVKFLLHFSAKDLLNALQMCYADEIFCQTIAVEQRNRLVSLLIKIMLTDNNEDHHYADETADENADHSSETKTFTKTLTLFTPSQVAHLFTFIARLIAGSSSTTATNEVSGGVVDVNRALLEQILHHLCQNNFTTRNADSNSNDDERESALIELFEAGALQCMNEALIVEKAKKAQFLTFIKLVYSRNARFDELFLALLECIVANKRRKVVDAEEVGELFTAARKVLVNDEAVDPRADAEKRVAVALLEHVVFLTQTDAEQTSFLVLQYFIKRRIAVEIISDTVCNGRTTTLRTTSGGAKIILLPQIMKDISSPRHRRMSEDEVLLSILRVFDAFARIDSHKSADDDYADDAGVQRAKFDFIMCFWKRGLLPLNYSAAALEMSGGGAGFSCLIVSESSAQQASARICWLLIDWTCQELANLKRAEMESADFEPQRQEEDDDLTNTLLTILRSFYFTTMPSTADMPAFARDLVPNGEARQICRKHSIALAEAYLYELDGKFADAYRILFREQFCTALEWFCNLVTKSCSDDDENANEKSRGRSIVPKFHALMNDFEVLLEYCQRVNNRVPADDHDDAASLPSSDETAADLNFTRQQMWLNVFEQFMTLMKHVETLQNSADGETMNEFDQILERSGDALQRLLAAMIVYHVDMLHVLKQLVMSSSSAASTMLAVPKNGIGNRFRSAASKAPSEQHPPRIRLILDNIIASYEYQCTLYESVTTLMQHGVYSSLAHYLRSMRNRGIRVAGFRAAATASTTQQHPSAMHYYHNADGGFFYNKLWRNPPTPAEGGGLCSVCNKPMITCAIEFGCSLRNSLSSRQNYSSTSRQRENQDDDVAVLHSGLGNRLAHLQCIMNQQQRRRMHNSSEIEESEGSGNTASAASAERIPVNSADDIGDIYWSFE